jgi:hypothetical protein
MAKKTKRGRKQDRVRVAGKQDYEDRYEAKKTGKSKAKVKRGREKSWSLSQKSGTRPLTDRTGRAKRSPRYATPRALASRPQSGD